MRSVQLNEVVACFDRAASARSEGVDDLFDLVFGERVGRSVGAAVRLGSGTHYFPAAILQRNARAALWSTGVVARSLTTGMRELEWEES